MRSTRHGKSHEVNCGTLTHPMWVGNVNLAPKRRLEEEEKKKEVTRDFSKMSYVPILDIVLSKSYHIASHDFVNIRLIEEF